MPGVPDGKRYSPLDRESVHADMRIDLVTAKRNIARQPGVLSAHRDCATCAELDPVLAWRESRRAKVVLTMPEIAEGVGLPPGARPVRMYVTDDPHLLHLVFEDNALEPVPAEAETPYALLRDETPAA